METVAFHEFYERVVKLRPIYSRKLPSGVRMFSHNVRLLHAVGDKLWKVSQSASRVPH